MPVDDLIGSTEKDSFISRQVLIIPTDEIDIGSKEIGEDSSESPRSTSPSPTHVAINTKAANIKLKKDSQRRNRKLKDTMYIALKAHRKMLSDEGFMNDEKISYLISNSSFSGMHSLLEELSIVRFSRTYCTKTELIYIHKYHGYCLIIGPNMFVLCHEGKLHSGENLIPIAEANDIGQAATLLHNVRSSANGRPSSETMLTLHRTDLRLFCY